MSERKKFYILLLLLVASLALLWYVSNATSSRFTPFQR